MPLVKRSNAIRYKNWNWNWNWNKNESPLPIVVEDEVPSNVEEDEVPSSVVEESESDIEEDPYIQTWFGDEESIELLKQMRNRIVYVLIRGHSSLPYNSRRNEFDEYTMPDDMNLVKITAAANGAQNCPRISYPKKKKLITNFIKKNSNVNDPKEAADMLRIKLTNEEGEEDKLIKNVVSDNKIILNKVIFPLSLKEVEDRKEKEDYRAVEILFLDDDESKILLDIYDDIIGTKTSKLKKIENRPLPFKISDIINFLYHYFKLRNVVLLDFSCSSFWEGEKPVENKDELTDYLNNNNLHGGKVKKNKTKRNKTKRNKTKKNKRF